MTNDQPNPNDQNPNDAGTALLSPMGVMMLAIAVFLDLLSIICVILILAFGIGIVLAKIVYIVGCVIIFGWQLVNSGTISKQKNKRQAGVKLMKKFFKKQWKKMAAKAVPAIGDALPLWTWIVYSELKES